MDDTLCLFRQKAQEKGVTLSDNVTDAVPRLIRCDSMRLRQILTNLVGNALKFTEHGFISITVDCQPHHPEAPDGHGDFMAPSDLTLIVSVRDTGCGIPDDKLASIFESFTQVDSSTTRRFGGTGLGLAISSRLAQLLGGHLEVESALGQGSLFRLKLRTQSLASKPAMRPLSLAPSPSSRLADDCPLKILVAEDNLINQKLICKILTRFGYEPALVNNGAQALEALAQQPFDLIFMDVQMPVMDGLEASRLIRERCANPPGLIALTAFGLPEDRERFLAEGMDDYLSKPIFPNQVAELLGRWHSKLYPKPGVSQADYLDVESLLQRVSRDLEILHEMSGLFHEDGHRLIQELNQVYQQNDIVGVRRIAHELKGASLTLSATILHQRLGKIEALARDHKMTDIEPILNQLPFIFKQTQQALDALLCGKLAHPLDTPIGTQATSD
jgi:CheY-like chemotaxis protein